MPFSVFWDWKKTNDDQLPSFKPRWTLDEKPNAEPEMNICVTYVKQSKRLSKIKEELMNYFGLNQPRCFCNSILVEKNSSQEDRETPLLPPARIEQVFLCFLKEYLARYKRLPKERQPGSDLLFLSVSYICCALFLTWFSVSCPTWESLGDATTVNKSFPL